jgi:hypothetical protein
MKYRNHTFFKKYQIEPNIPLSQLKVSFQTDPNKRKDLPIVVKTISNQQALLEEELFTPHIPEGILLTVHGEVLNLIEEMKQKVTNDGIQNIGEKLIYLCQHEDEWNSLFYAKGFETKAKEIIKEFLECLFDELKHVFINTIGEVSNTITEKFYDMLVEVSGCASWLLDKKEELIDDLCEYVDNSLSLDNHSKAFESKLASLLILAEKTKHDFFKSSLRYAINKMIDDIDNYGDILLNNYKYIAKVYSENDLLEISSFIAKVANKYCDITGISTDCTPTCIVNGCKKIIESYDLLKKSVINIVDINSGKNAFIVEDMNNFYQNAVFMSDAGADWYNEYRSKLNKLSSNCTMESMYNIVSHVMSAKPNSDIKDLFSNIILGHSDFKIMFPYILHSHEDVANKKADKYINPNDIDDFIGKYYWLIYMLKDTSNFNENTFNNIRNFSFDILQIYESQLNRLKNTYNGFEKALLISQINSGLTLALQKIPKDFFYNDSTRVVDAINKFGGTHNGIVSESSLYIDKYSDLFGKSRTKYGRAAYENRNTYRSSNSGSSSSNNSGCYVATCVYGSYDCPEVWILRRYRDGYLDNRIFGRLFIKLYYAISPKLVKLFGNKKWFKALFKKFLEKKIEKLRIKGYADTPYNDKY